MSGRMSVSLPRMSVRSTSCSKDIRYVPFTAGAHTQTRPDQMEDASNRRPHRSSQPPQDETRALVETRPFLRTLNRRGSLPCQASKRNNLPQRVSSRGGRHSCVF